jgi:hypothetical protein
MAIVIVSSLSVPVYQIDVLFFLSVLDGGWPTLSTILTVAGAPLLSRFPRRGGDVDFLNRLGTARKF